ncbi:MAG: FtsX-like permease family protein [Rhodospirillales bacterium]|nr:MAG: FtsX-like permease family protein [Rhodospirillales bacterium]
MTPSRRGPTRFLLTWRLARRELRGGLSSRFRGFRIFLSCLVLGTAAIAGIGSVSSSIEAGLRADARVLLGGDIELRVQHRPATAAQREWLGASARMMSEIVALRAMASRTDGQDRRLVELRAVDEAYPLVGRVVLRGAAPLPDALAARDGVFGLVAAEPLLERLKVSVGDPLTIGAARFRITGVLLGEPDRATRGIQLGPRVIISRTALDATQLLKPGALSRFYYRLLLPAGTDGAAFKERLAGAFPDAAWRVRDPAGAAPGLRRFIDRLTLFLTLVGLSALLIGGIGIGNAVHAFLTQRRPTIATLKCLGASAGLVLGMYLAQILLLALAGILAGLALGAASPLAAAPLLGDLLPVGPRAGIYPGPLALAAAFGVLTTLLFSLGPLMMARDVPAAALFRKAVAPTARRLSPQDLAALTAIVLALALLTVVSAEDRMLAVWFVAGAIMVFAAFRLAAAAVTRLAAAWPRPSQPQIRLALANLHRPGAPTGSVVVSLGMGITVLVAIMMVERNLSDRIAEIIEDKAPAFFFLDIQPDQRAGFEALVRSFPGAGAVRQVPMLRGRITAMGGVPVSQLAPPPDHAWVIRGDRGLTWARTPPDRGSRIVAGEWWPADYDGPPLISFDAEAAESFGLAIGDEVSFNILGRPFVARIANLRRIDWASLGMNFVVIFSPGALEQAPQISIATVHIDEASETALEAAVSKQFPNVSAIRVRDVLADVNRIMGSVDIAAKSIAAVAIVAGILVLSGAIAAGRRQRIYDAVVLKTLGATRRDVLVAYLIEFALLGLVTAAIGALAGSLAAWAVTAGLMRVDWVFAPGTMIWTTLVCVGATLVFGAIGAWRALGRKAAPLLRNE